MLDEFVTIPQLDAPTTVALGRELLSNLPRVKEPRVQRAAKRLKASMEALRAAWTARRESESSAASPEERRAADVRLDRAWGAVYRRTEALAALADYEVEGAARAAEFMAGLFAEGLGFLQKPYKQEWALSEQLLARIDAEGAAEALAEVAGAAVLAELREAHAAYGKTLGVTTRTEAPTPGTLIAEPLRAALSSARSYALQVVALLEPDDPESETLVRTALRPIAEARQAFAERRGAGADSVAEPLPEAPDAATTAS